MQNNYIYSRICKTGEYKINGLWYNYVQVQLIVVANSLLYLISVNKIRETGDEASANMVYKTKRI